MTSSDSLLLALLPVSENEEYEELDERSIRLVLLVEVVLEDVVADWDDCAATSALPVEPVWAGAAGSGATREMPDVPTDPI